MLGKAGKEGLKMDFRNGGTNLTDFCSGGGKRFEMNSGPKGKPFSDPAVVRRRKEDSWASHRGCNSNLVGVKSHGGGSTECRGKKLKRKW